MRQVVSPDKQIARRDRHVLRQLTFDREIRLISISVFKVLADMQGERKHRPKAWKRLVVEPLATKLILGGGSSAWRIKPWRTQRIVTRYCADCPLKYLRCVERRCRGWTTHRRQDALLL